MNRQHLIPIAALAWMMGAVPAWPEQVELRLRGGDMVIRGDLVSIEGNAAIIASPAFGVMMVEADRYDCAGPGCTRLGPKDEAFGISGSNTVGEALTPALVEAYAGARKFRVEKRLGASAEEVQIDLFNDASKKVASIDAQSHGSGTAFPNLRSGAAEIGASSRPIKDEELKELTVAGLKVDAHVLALDGLPIILSPSNPVSELTLEQIGKIFAGQITDWAQVGGDAGPINLYARDNKSGTFDTFDTLVLKPLKLKISENAKRFESSVELSDTVTRDPAGIGFIGLAYLRNAKALTIGTTCGVASKPSEFNVKTEEYSLSRRLFYYTTDKIKSVHAKGLLTFALSDEAQQVISDTGFINQKIDSLPFEEQADRFAAGLAVPPEDFDLRLMKDLVTTVRGASRLSVTFRFEKGSGALELKARQDITRLARFLKSEEGANRRLLLLGFADSTGLFAANSAVSLVRADSVRSALVAASGGTLDASKIDVKGFGELMPVDCNTTDDGRAKNRRVEVWVRN
jgi:phosphate transport system substrate-binding protein